TGRRLRERPPPFRVGQTEDHVDPRRRTHRPPAGPVPLEAYLRPHAPAPLLFARPARASSDRAPFARCPFPFALFPLISTPSHPSHPCVGIRRRAMAAVRVPQEIWDQEVTSIFESAPYRV